VHPSTLAPLLISLMAKVKIFGPQGAREIALDQFYRTPKSDGERGNVLQPNEIVTEIIVPPPGNVRVASYEIRHREMLDWPLSMASVALTLNGKKVNAARLTLGHVAPVPWPADEAAKFLVGKTISEDVAAEAGKIAVAQAKALSRNAYKIQLTQVAVKRAILQAAG
jgi:xanthine dehydrogenase YagS FAD-binding subunit